MSCWLGVEVKVLWRSVADFFFGDRADHDGDPEPWTIETTAWKGYQLVFISVQRQLITSRCVFGSIEGSTWGIHVGIDLVCNSFWRPDRHIFSDVGIVGTS